MVLLRAHQRELDLVLHVLDMEGAAGIGTAGQAGNDLRGEASNMS